MEGTRSDWILHIVLSSANGFVDRRKVKKKEKNQRLCQDLWSDRLEKQIFHLLRSGKPREKKVREEGQEFHFWTHEVCEAISDPSSNDKWAVGDKSLQLRGKF